ncbi:hypothetical protein CERZMDRAFT_93703 [Cercospora zeae-maydis SCOH1-5]|uniref:Uncharacterized protein n=1 Tax=Cercospora zeae-maydis SCOH1-5 TaxID=717836 RepID=A0A6A6FTA5_9PEZI|nr:hypothetical protein CERZMDRAFT_93703 [Cercospora zeae-maydis SCOH1-5]
MARDNCLLQDNVVEHDTCSRLKARKQARRPSSLGMLVVLTPALLSSQAFMGDAWFGCTAMSVRLDYNPGRV